MRKTVISLLAFLVLAASAMVAVPAFGGNSGPGPLKCVGKVTGSYTDDGAKPETFDYSRVTVPAGKSCVLKNVAVKGNVKSLHGSKNVKVLDSYVGGNVHVKDASGTVHVGQSGCKYDPAVRVNVLVYDSHHVLVCWVTGHNIQLKRNDGRVTVRDSVAHRIDVSRNKECVKCRNGHRRPQDIRILRNEVKQHIHAFKNHKSRKVIDRGNNKSVVIR